MQVSEETRKSILQEYETNEAIKKARHSKAVFDAVMKLEREIRDKLDLGDCMMDITIEFKNRLWRMNEDGADRESPEYIALSDMVHTHDQLFAEQYYSSQGWHKKHSGEWIRER